MAHTREFGVKPIRHSPHRHNRDRMLLGPDRNRSDVVLPFQLEFACVAAGGDCILQLFDSYWRFLDFHVDAPQIHARIVGVAVLTGLFIDDELPLFRVLHQDVKRIGAGRLKSLDVRRYTLRHSQ